MGRLSQYRRALRSCAGRPLAYQVHDGWGASLFPTLERVIRHQGARDAEIFEAYDDGALDNEARAIVAARRSAPTLIPGKGGKATAIVSVHGIALYDFEWQPYAYSSLLLAQTIKALANDPEIGTIVLDINSPGGQTTGTKEAADAVYAARATKKVIALVNPLAASAAYHVASQAEEIIAVPSADVGSIGVFAMHMDFSGALEQAGIKPTFVYAGAHKVEFNGYEPLGDAAKEFLQGQVDTIYDGFLKDVARGRGVPVSKVKSDFGQGRSFLAREAFAAGMIDRIATLDVAMARLGVRPATGSDDQRRSEDLAHGGVAENLDTYIVGSNANDLGEALAATETHEGEEEPSEFSGLPMMLFSVFANDGGEKIYAENNWPHKARFAVESMFADRDPHFSMTDGKVIIACANGDAVYRIEAETALHLDCSLVESTWQARPEENADEADPIAAVVDPDETLVVLDAGESVDDEEHKKAIDKRARRLAMLRHG